MNGSATTACEPLASPTAGMPERHAETHGERNSKITLTLAGVLLLLGLALLGLRLAGYQYVSTRGDSMKPTILPGSLLVVRQIPPQQVRAGDIVVFPSQLEGVPNIAHRVVALEEDGRDIVAVTMGDNNPVPDPDPLFLDKPVSRMVMTIPYIGWWVTPSLRWYLLAVALLLSLKSALDLRAWQRLSNGIKGLSPKVQIDGVIMRKSV